MIALAATSLVVLFAAFAGKSLTETHVSEAVVVPQRVAFQLGGALANGQPQSQRHAKMVMYGPRPGPAPTSAPANGNVPLSGKAPVNAPQIAREGKITLFAGDVQSAVSRISEIARHQGGDVLSLDATSAADSAPAAAQITVRIPADRFDATMEAIGTAGKVRERSIDANDLSGDITDSTARLRNLRRTEADIRHIMDRSGSVSQVLDAENQLSQVREQIETLESSLKSMQTRVVYSTIDISVQAETSAAPVEPTFASQLVSAWRAAAHALGQFTVSIVAAILWLVVFLPYALVFAAIAWLVYRRRTVART